MLQQSVGARNVMILVDVWGLGGLEVLQRGSRGSGNSSTEVAEVAV
jgi:hypothetical protein